MPPISSCPRCSTQVHYETGQSPTCASCGFPGADLRDSIPSGTEASWVADPWAAEHPTVPHDQLPQPLNSGKAVAALVLGISSYFLFVAGFVTAVLAIVFGSIARKEIEASQGQLKGKGMATWGLWLGLVPIAIIPAIVFMTFVSKFLSGQ